MKNKIFKIQNQNQKIMSLEYKCPEKPKNS